MTASAQTSLNFDELARLMRIPPCEEPTVGLWNFPLRRVAAGDVLCRRADRLTSIYVVRTGVFKSVYRRGVNEHVVAFPMAGDAVGVDSFGGGSCMLETVALENCEVAVLPPLLLKQMDCRPDKRAPLLFEMLYRESARKLEMIAIMIGGNAAMRAAAFLLDFGERLEQRGYSSHSFHLPMRQADLASHLALRPETLSRAFSALNASALVDIHLKSIAIRDMDGLREVADGLRSLEAPHDVAPHHRQGMASANAAWARP